MAGSSRLNRTITDRRLLRLHDYVADLQGRLGLTEWDIALKLDQRPDGAEATAEVRVTKNRLRASLYFAEDFFTDSPSDQRHVVVHELCHLPMDQVDSVVWDGDINLALGAAAFAVYGPVAKKASEQAVDRFATMLAQYLPLPALDASRRRSTRTR